MTEGTRPGEITRLLARLGEGGDDASAQIFDLVYDRMRQHAARIMGAGAGSTLQPTALVHEAWLKLDGKLAGLEDRQHFFAVAGLAMRHILKDRARSARALKRDGGDRVALSMDEAADGLGQTDADLIALDDALTKLHGLHARHAEVATLRFLAGMTIEETAEVVGVSPNTVVTDWAMARAWLRAELER